MLRRVVRSSGEFNACRLFDREKIGVDRLSGFFWENDVFQYIHVK